MANATAIHSSIHLHNTIPISAAEAVAVASLVPVSTAAASPAFDGRCFRIFIIRPMLLIDLTL
jgi:hypothetical protein